MHIVGVRIQSIGVFSGRKLQHVDTAMNQVLIISRNLKQFCRSIITNMIQIMNNKMCHQSGNSQV